jgi:hypothetical protein
MNLLPQLTIGVTTLCNGHWFRETFSHNYTVNLDTSATHSIGNPITMSIWQFLVDDELRRMRVNWANFHSFAVSVPHSPTTCYVGSCFIEETFLKSLDLLQEKESIIRDKPKPRIYVYCSQNKLLPFLGRKLPTEVNLLPSI